jgi:FdhD protein
MTDRPTSTSAVTTWEVDGAALRAAGDSVATEEPLEIRVVIANKAVPVAVTMRTPGADFELAAGFLYGEGVIRSRDAIRTISYCLDKELDVQQRYNIVNVELVSGLDDVDLAPLERHFSITSACGVCGKASIDALALRGQERLTSSLRIEPGVLSGLSGKMRAAQTAFESTGGLHASGLFSPSGDLTLVREDVGRHNAMDKLVGWAVLNDKVPISEAIVLVSGRTSFELVQKALAAGVPVICSVSAPSSLAVALASTYGITLVGFLRGERFRVYAHPERIGSSDREGLPA